MGAIITILKENSSESIQMQVEPDELIERILSRCKLYWGIDKENVVLKKGDSVLDIDKLVIDSNVQDGDVIKLASKTEDRKKEIGRKNSKVKDQKPIQVAKRWLQKNIGLECEDIELVEEKELGNTISLLFANKNLEEHYSIKVDEKNGIVVNYVPALTDEFAVREGGCSS